MFSLKNTRLRGDPVAVYNNLMAGYREDGARLFLKVKSDKTRSSGYKVDREKFCLDIRKKIPLRGSSDAGTGCAQRLWSLYPRR